MVLAKPVRLAEDCDSMQEIDDDAGVFQVEPLSPASSGLEARPRNDAVHLSRVDAQNIHTLRALNLELFPVRYTNAFYHELLYMHQDYAKLAYADTNVVGAISCRLEAIEKRPGVQRTYIMTLGVLKAYQRSRVGSKLLESAIEQSRRDNADHIYLHVQTSNTVALAFYRHFGFEVTETLHNYYKRIEPPDCYVLLKPL